MAEIILAALCILVGIGCGLLALLALWAGALEQAATGSTSSGPALWLAIAAVVCVGGGASILIF